MYKICSHRVLRIFIILIAGLGITQGASAQDTLQINVYEAVERALRVSPEVNEVVSSQEFAEARWRFARANRFLPELKLNTAHSLAPGLKNEGDTPTETLFLNPDVRNDWNELSPFNRFEGQAVQPLYTWGELSQSIRAARFGVDLEKGAVRTREAEIALRTAELYTNLMLTEELYRLTGRIGDVLAQAKTEIQRLLDDGDEGVDEADMFQVQISEQEYKRRVVEVAQQREIARMALRLQLVLPENTVLQTRSRTLEPLPFQLDSLDSYVNLAIDHRPELAQAAAGLQARNALVDVAKSNYYPKLFFGVNASAGLAAGRHRQPSPYVGDAFRSRSFQAGFGIRQNLNFSQTRAKVEQATAERNQAKYQGEAAQLLVLFEVEEAYRNFKIEKANLEARDESMKLGKLWLVSEMNNFEYDLGDTENLVKAVQSGLQLEAVYYEAVKRYNIAVLRLLDACGVLVRLSANGTFVE